MRATLPADLPLRLLFQDEARFGRISDRRRCWAPLPARPVVSQQVIRQYVYALSAVSPCDGRLTSLVMPWVDAETMSIFLRHTARAFPGEACLMLLDGAGWHRAKALRIPSNMALLFLPPYSPELNPVEHVWGYLRNHVFGNRTFEALEEVVEVLCAGLSDLARQPKTVHSMTSSKWINTLY